MNMCNITFEVPRLSTFMFKKSLEKKIFTIIFVVKSLKGFGWNNVGQTSQMVAQHYFTIATATLAQHCFNVSCLPERWYCIGCSPPLCAH